MAIPLSSFLSKGSGALPFLLKDVDLKGGFRVVADIAERDTVHMGARAVGMLVFVTATSEFFQWIGGVWEPWDVTSMVTVGDGLTNAEGSISVDTAYLDTLYSGVAHVHNIEGVTGLQTALDGKSNSDHEHSASSLTDVTITTAADGDLLVWDNASSSWVNSTVAAAGLAAANHDHSGVYSPVGHDHAGVYASVNHDHDADYAPISHNHAIADITNLQIALDGLAPVSHTHDWSSIQNVPKVTAMPGVTVSSVDPGPTDGADGDVWFVIPA